MKNRVLIISLLVIIVATVSFKVYKNCVTMKDPRDGKIYKVVKIGKQTWMAQNLNFETKDSYCYSDAPFNCEKFGRLYTWDAAMTACPPDWHLPSMAEYDMLFRTVFGKKSTFGGEEDEKTEMIRSTSGWWHGGNGTDSFGFSAMPAGHRNRTGNYDYRGKVAFFWSFLDDECACERYIFFSYDVEFSKITKFGKDEAFSVRCVKD